MKLFISDFFALAMFTWIVYYIAAPRALAIPLYADIPSERNHRRVQPFIILLSYVVFGFAWTRWFTQSDVVVCSTGIVFWHAILWGLSNLCCWGALRLIFRRELTFDRTDISSITICEHHMSIRPLVFILLFTYTVVSYMSIMLGEFA